MDHASVIENHQSTKRLRILLTGCAGFIGSHTLDRLLADGHTVVGVDNFDPFYPRALKQANIEAHLGVPGARSSGVVEDGSSGVEEQNSKTPELQLSNTPDLHPSASKGSFELVEADLADETTYTKLKFLMGNEPFDAVLHLAAKAGVRPSIEDPIGYQRANVIATQNLLEFAKEQGIQQFVFASSSSVYGVNPHVPWREDDHVLQPISPYASTKVSCELLGHVYSHLYGIRFLGLRFFTVFGPRQRPDLAINKFVRLIQAGEPIPVFGDGSTRRDYTYVADVVDGIIKCTEKAVASGPPLTENGKRSVLQSSKSEGGKTEEPGSAPLPAYEVVNLGNDRTVTLQEMIEIIEEVVGKKAIIDRKPQQPGDVPQTWADVSKADQLFGYKPKTTFKNGVAAFYEWWKQQPSVRRMTPM